MVRHFGMTDLAKIAGSDDKDAIEKVEKRVQRLLNDPSQDNAEDEYDKFGNHAITHDGGSAMRVLGLSFVLLVHRGAISIVIAAICIGLGAVKAAKYIVLGLSVYQLIWWLLKHGRKARQWFTDRLMWCMVTIFADILFSMALFFLVELCTKISAYSVLLMLAVDVILIVLLRFVIKNLPTIMSKLMEDGKIVAEGMLLGTSPISTYRQLKGSPSQSDAFDGGSEGNGSSTGGYGERDDGDLRDHDDPYDSSYDDDALRDEKDPDMYSDDIQDDVDSADHEEAPADGDSESAGQAGPATSSEGAPTEAESKTEGSDEMTSEKQEDIDGGAQETDPGDDGESFNEEHTADIQNMSAETQEEEDLSDEADIAEEDISDVEGVPETVDPETEDDLEDRFDDDPIPTEAADHTDPEVTVEETSSASTEDSPDVEMNTEPTQATQQPDDPNSVPAGMEIDERGQESGPMNEQNVPSDHKTSIKPEEDTLQQEEENLLNEGY